MLSREICLHFSNQFCFNLMKQNLFLKFLVKETKKIGGIFMGGVGSFYISLIISCSRHKYQHPVLHNIIPAVFKSPAFPCFHSIPREDNEWPPSIPKGRHFEDLHILTTCWGIFSLPGEILRTHLSITVAIHLDENIIGPFVSRINAL